MLRTIKTYLIAQLLCNFIGISDMEYIFWWSLHHHVYGSVLNLYWDDLQ